MPLHRSTNAASLPARFAVFIAAVVSGCSSKSASSTLPECVGATDPPMALECTGLYTNIATQQLASTAVPYAPATPLWSDGATKQRWIYLPSGTTIDRSDPNEWTFPLGTKVWKEFSYNGTRVETRYFEKQRVNAWAYTTYLWSADGTSATQSGGGDIPFPGDFDNTYHVPTSDECNQCHRGRTDRLLGFEEVSLGLPGATGLTLPVLAQQGLLTPVPTATALSIGDDGTGDAAPAMAWLHINCGTTCHNRNQVAEGYSSGMFLRLDPTLLDGQPSNAFDTRATTVGVSTVSPAFQGADRIVPGNAKASILAQLIALRGPSDQMPPIASRVVDTTDVANVDSWIDKMPGASPPDGGVKDAAEDAKEDARMTDARVEDAHDDARDAEDDARRDAEADAGAHDATVDAPDDDIDGGDARTDATVDSAVDATVMTHDAANEPDAMSAAAD